MGTGSTRRFDSFYPDMNIQRYVLNSIDTGQFTTIPIELKDYIGFTVRRVYFMTKTTTGYSRQHAHYVEQEFFFLLQGKATLVIDEGMGLGKEEHVLEPRDAVYVPSRVWHGFKDVSEDAIIVALSSTNYDATRRDYLEDYDIFRNIKESG